MIGTLRRRKVDMSILMISALSEADERVRVLRAGGDDYLTKGASAAVTGHWWRLVISVDIDALMRPWRRRAPPQQGMVEPPHQ